MGDDGGSELNWFGAGWLFDEYGLIGCDGENVIGGDGLGGGGGGGGGGSDDGSVVANWFVEIEDGGGKLFP